MLANYSKNYYAQHQDGARRSAREVMPLVLKLVQPRSVIDVGCGSGSWLSLFSEHGVSDIFGVDGGWISKEILEIPEEKFLAFDLRNTFKLGRRFDLVVSLEVAEHLPPQCADTFVKSLTQLGPVILFSAAIPLQEGIDHQNEQWPEYWAERFEREGYSVLDPLRKQIWQNKNVEFWYIQNILLYVHQGYLEKDSGLRKVYHNTSRAQLSLVHPRLFLERSQNCRVHREKIERYVAEVEQLKAEAQAHREKAELFIAENGKLTAENRAHRDKVELYVAQVEQVKAQIQAQNELIKSYVAEVEQLKAEAQAHREKADFFIAENEELKTECETHRHKAEDYVVEVEQLKAEVRAHKDAAEYYIAEAEQLKAEISADLVAEEGQTERHPE